MAVLVPELLADEKRLLLNEIIPHLAAFVQLRLALKIKGSDEPSARTFCLAIYWEYGFLAPAPPEQRNP